MIMIMISGHRDDGPWRKGCMMGALMCHVAHVALLDHVLRMGLRSRR